MKTVITTSSSLNRGNRQEKNKKTCFLLIQIAKSTVQEMISKKDYKNMLLKFYKIQYVLCVQWVNVIYNDYYELQL